MQNAVVHTLPSPCVVVLVGPGAAGKSTWAAANFAPDQIVSSDRLRAVIGAGEDDITASADALALLDTIVRARVGRRLTTVIDTLGLDAARRAGWRALAAAHDLPCVAVAFDTPAAACRERNRARDKRIPVDVLRAQLASWRSTRALLSAEGFHAVLTPDPVRTVPPEFLATVPAPAVERPATRGLRFGLHLSTFDTDVRELAVAAEAAGFDAVYVMDHFRQIPQIGRAWEPFYESYTTLAYLAAVTERVQLGALVTGVTYRNVGHLGKIVATLDVLSGGRAVCGLGLGWFKEEHTDYGWEFPSVARRYDLLTDALQALPLLWGPGNPPFAGRAISLPKTLCYPRPVQAHVPIVVGGGGERRTLRLAAQYADTANVLGDLATVRRKKAVLQSHCADTGRDVALSHLGTILLGSSDAEVAATVERLRPRRQSATAFAASVAAGTVDDHITRFRALADAGVAEVVVRLADPNAVSLMADVVGAFR